MKGHLFNAAPRIGFAWDPKGDGKMPFAALRRLLEHTTARSQHRIVEGSAPFSLNALSLTSTATKSAASALPAFRQFHP